MALTFTAIAAAVAFTLTASPAADNGGRGGHGHGGGRGGGHHARATFVLGAPYLFSPFAWDWLDRYGWGYPGYAYRPQGGLDPVIARAEGLGGFDLDIKPRRAEVWVDGKLVGLVRDSTAIPRSSGEQGEHTLALSMPGFMTWEQNVMIDAGRVSDMKIALAPAPSAPPSSD